MSELINEVSPMMAKYLETKKEYPDCLLFYRLGDFYEMFFEDAVTVSRELDLVLTGKDCGQEERAPMCGVPFHSADSYIAKLVSRGYKVAICEQVENPAEAKGIVKRDVIRVITPGTVIESNILALDVIATHQHPYSKYGEGLELLRQGKALKVIMYPDGSR